MVMKKILDFTEKCTERIFISHSHIYNETCNVSIVNKNMKEIWRNLNLQHVINQLPPDLYRCPLAM